MLSNPTIRTCPPCPAAFTRRHRPQGHAVVRAEERLELAGARRASPTRPGWPWPSPSRRTARRRSSARRPRSRPRSRACAAEPLKVVGTPSRIATSSPGLSLPARYSPDRSRALAVVGADEGDLRPRSARTVGVELVVDVDDRRSRRPGPSCRPRRGPWNRPGRSRCASTCWAIICSTSFDLGGEVELVLDPVGDQLVLGGVCFAWWSLAPVSIVLKNSLASDFMTSAIRGREGVAEGAFWHAVPAAPTTLARAKSTEASRPAVACGHIVPHSKDGHPAGGGLRWVDRRALPSGFSFRKRRSSNGPPSEQPLHPRPWPRHRLLCALR